MVGIVFAIVAVLLLSLCGGLLLFIFVRAEHDARDRMPRRRGEEVARYDTDKPPGEDP